MIKSKCSLSKTITKCEIHFYIRKLQHVKANAQYIKLLYINFYIFFSQHLTGINIENVLRMCNEYILFGRMPD